MKNFEVIECKIKDETIFFGSKIFYSLIYKIDNCKFKYDMFTYEHDKLTEEEFISKVKKELWHNLKI